MLLFELVAVSAGAQGRRGDSDVTLRYRALVQAYRTGDVDAATKGMLSLNQDVVDALVRRYVTLAHDGFDRDSTLDEEFFRAAAMLHAEAAFRCWDHLQLIDCGAQVDMARRLVDVGERAGRKAGSFRRRWYAAAGLILTTHLTADNSVAFFEDAVRKFPDDVPLLTAAGWFSERLSFRSASPGAALKNAQAMRRKHQQRAAMLFQQALDVEAGAAEPTLRLARVEAAMGDLERARNRLTKLVARDGVPPLLAYVARLTLGELHERRGEAAEAERHYRQAMTLDQVAQSARVALARVLYTSGDPAGAAEVIEPAVRTGVQRDRNDPWADYQLAYPAVGRLLFDELRKEVQR
jgi:tetratricopeptide (TPR) repeat protein